MWLKLTQRDGKPVKVNMDNVSTYEAGQATQVAFRSEKAGMKNPLGQADNLLQSQAFLGY